MSKIFELNPEQQKAFNRLVKAYKDCEKLKILFVNNYGTIEAYDKKYIKNYVDSIGCDPYSEDELISSHESNHALNTFESVDSWADDEHFVVLTSAGKKQWEKDNS